MFHYDKQNHLSFQNITQTMKISKSKKDGLCFYHHDKPAKYKDKQSTILYCKSCAVQMVAKGAWIEDFPKKINQLVVENVSLLDQIYEEAQKSIQQQINQYKQKYQKLQEAITDMHISDLLSFNKKLQENNALFLQLKAFTNKRWNTHELTQKFLSQDYPVIIDKINTLQEQINISSCKKMTNYMQSPVIANRNKSEKIQNINLKVSNTSLQERYFNSREVCKPHLNISEKSQKNTNSYTSKNNSKNNSTLEDIKKSDAYQDTPESIKFRTSDNCFKVTTDMAVTMFQKIDICESINLQNNFISQSHKQDSSLTQKESQRSSLSSLKSRYRYGTINQSQQQ